MRYLMTTRPSDTAPDERLYAEMGKFIEELTAAGVLLATGGLEPGGILVRSAGEEITVTEPGRLRARKGASADCCGQQ